MKSKFIFVVLLCLFFMAMSSPVLHSEDLQPIQVIKLLITQTYDNAPQIQLPIRELVQRLIEYGGIKLVDVDSEEYDATLEIEVSGHATQEVYTYEGVEYRLYSGATIGGTISLVMREYRMSKSFSGSEKPSRFITLDRTLAEEVTDMTTADVLKRTIAKYSTPSKVDIYEAFDGPFVSAFLDILRYLRGPSILISCFEDKDYLVKFYAQKELVSIGQPAIEILIETLKSDKSNVREWAGLTLQKITGKDFGSEYTDYETWSHWLQNSNK